MVSVSISCLGVHRNSTHQDRSLKLKGLEGGCCTKHVNVSIARISWHLDALLQSPTSDITPHPILSNPTSSIQNAPIDPSTKHKSSPSYNAQLLMLHVVERNLTHQMN
jgi:hypothetical protein